VRVRSLVASDRCRRKLWKKEVYEGGEEWIRKGS
jgi:hypothetical protein